MQICKEHLILKIIYLRSILILISISSVFKVVCFLTEILYASLGYLELHSQPIAAFQSSHEIGSAVLTYERSTYYTFAFYLVLYKDRSIDDRW